MVGYSVGVLATPRGPMDQDPKIDRRRNPRTSSSTTAVVRQPGFIGRYFVRNLSVTGALLAGGDPLQEGEEVALILQVVGSPPIRMRARVVHHVDTLDGAKCNGVDFLHESDLTREQLEAALLTEIASQALDPDKLVRSELSQE